MENIFNVVAAILTSSAAPRTAQEFVSKDGKPAEVVDNLRRQLMRDNYDYMMEETAVTPPGLHADSQRTQLDEHEETSERIAASKTVTLETPIDFYTKSVTRRDVTRTTIKLIGLRRNPMYDHKSKYLMPSDRRKLATSGIDKVLYDDDESKVRKQNDRLTLKELGEAGDVTFLYELDDGNGTALGATVKYSMLKVKEPARRSARKPHLLKEEKPGEVSIVNLGEGAMPQFRLPRPRRQYMRDSDRDSELDVGRAHPAALDLDR